MTAARWNRTTRPPTRKVWAVVACLVLSPGIIMVSPGTSRAQGGADAVTARAVAARTEVHPGDVVPIAVVLEHPEGFHSWPNIPVMPPALRDFVPIPTTIEVITLPEGAAIQDVQWPNPVAVRVRYTDTPVDILSYVGTTVVFVPVALDAGQPLGATSVVLRVEYQSCDERVCYRPREVDLTVPLWVAATGTALPAVNEPHLFVDFGLESLGVRVSTPAYVSLFGWSFTFEPTGFGRLSLLLAFATLGGFLLNLTPCVLPLIPVKVLGLQSAAARPRRLAQLGIAMGFGVVAFWMVLGLAIGMVTGMDAISSLFQTGWFAPVVGLVIGIAAFGLLGNLTIRLPQGIYRIDPSAESVPGSFGFGVMTAVLATPCTAPFMGGAAAWATLQPPMTTVATFGAIGIGMALPYVALAARPQLLERLPRSGPGGVLLKQVMGLLMLAIAAFFLGSGLSTALHQPPDAPTRWFWWIVGASVIAAFGWLAFRVPSVTSSRGWRIALRGASVVVMVMVALTTRSLASHGPIDWVGFTPERFDDARSRGAVIVMDFTAEWCLNCKVLESAVLHQDRVAEVLESPGVVPMRVDLTTSNPPGQAKLKELGWVGIPLLAVFGPGVGYEEPIRYDSYTSRMVEDAISRAASTP